MSTSLPATAPNLQIFVSARRSFAFLIRNRARAAAAHAEFLAFEREEMEKCIQNQIPWGMRVAHDLNRLFGTSYSRYQSMRCRDDAGLDEKHFAKESESDNDGDGTVARVSVGGSAGIEPEEPEPIAKPETRGRRTPARAKAKSASKVCRHTRTIVFVSSS